MTQKLSITIRKIENGYLFSHESDLFSSEDTYYETFDKLIEAISRQIKSEFR